MTKEKTLRDEIAMSMPHEAVPVLNDIKTINLISKKYNLTWNDNPIDQIKWSMEYQAIIRYMYADEMLRKRNESKK